jgi:hypothetical protein
MKNLFIISIFAITSALIFSDIAIDQSLLAKKRTRTHEKGSIKREFGRGANSKAKRTSGSEPKSKTKEKIVKEITPYKKSVTAGKRVTERESREKRVFSRSRKRLLKLLKEKIDGRKIIKGGVKFTKGELKLLRKLEALKKDLDLEEKKLVKLAKDTQDKDKKLSELLKLIRKERFKITKLLEAKKIDDERKLKRFIKMLEGIKPQQLAIMLENIDHVLFIEVAKTLKPKTFGKALKYMSKEKAIKLNEKFIAKE